MRVKIIAILFVGLVIAGIVVWMQSTASVPGPVASATPSVRSAPAPVEPTRPPAAPPAKTPAAKPAAPAPVVDTPPTTGTLHITSDVPDTSVFIDRQFLGTAPVTAKDLTPGTHHLNMSATGYDGVFEDIIVEAGEHTLAISLKDVKLDEKIAVVHKHLTGSCRGTLVATPQQLRYETTDKNDGFSVALADLEVFEADYIAKNLKLKIRKGKTYNFADAEDNVERLYSFQRAVDKVRKK